MNINEPNVIPALRPFPSCNERAEAMRNENGTVTVTVKKSSLLWEYIERLEGHVPEGEVADTLIRMLIEEGLYDTRECFGIDVIDEYYFDLTLLTIASMAQLDYLKRQEEEQTAQTAA